MGALLVRQLSPLQQEPAYTAHRIIMWYAGRMWTLWVLLITLPLVVLVTGFLTLQRKWSDDAERPQAEQRALAAIRADRTMKLVAGTMLTAGVVLVIVALHMLAN